MGESGLFTTLLIYRIPEGMMRFDPVHESTGIPQSTRLALLTEIPIRAAATTRTAPAATPIAPAAAALSMSVTGLNCCRPLGL